MKKRGQFWLILVGALGGALYFLRHKLLRNLFSLPPPQITAVRRQQIWIPMSDGIRLAADHYQPLTRSPGPTILIRTPYNRTQLQQRFFATQFARQGFQVIVQDTRGRFASAGRFQPRLFEQADGVETISWIRRQPWSNGRVGMWGQSYLGYVQWAAATQAPPGLQAIVPTLTTARGRGMFYSQGIFALEFILRWLVIVDGMDPLQGEKRRSYRHALRALPPLSDFFVGKLWRHLPLAELDRLAVGHTVDFYQDYLRHPPDDALFWGQVDFHDQLTQVEAAPHFISGWYDFLLNDF
jgi:putative CocE/NonD family hydrolase